MSTALHSIIFLLNHLLDTIFFLITTANLWRKGCNKVPINHLPHYH
jgi:hypothetical protein